MIRELSPGKVFLDYGPISMVISAWQKGIPLTDKCRESCKVAIKYLEEISSHLPKIKKAWPLCSESELAGSALLMWQAAKSSGDENLTPMATVAGLMSDHVADWLVKNGATKAIVNNGGDIALRLLENEETCVGIVPYLGADHFSRILRVKSTDNIGGIATSGLGGRSFTQGIVDSVTVLAPRCVIADAFATSIANASHISSPRVKQVKAKTLDPNTDIPELMITIEVGNLMPREIKESLKQIRQKAEKNLKEHKIKGAIAHLQGEVLMVPKQFFN